MVNIRDKDVTCITLHGNRFQYSNHLRLEVQAVMGVMHHATISTGERVEKPGRF